MPDKKCPIWGLALIVVVFVLILVFMVVNFARNMTIPFGAGTLDSGIVATKMLKHQGPVKNDYRLVAAIVEPREDNLVETINHYIHVLPTHTHFQVYHGTKNKAYLMAALADSIEDGKIELFDLGVENLTIMGYCKLMCSFEFWETIRSEKVLIFQTDSVTCSRSKYNLDDFMKYDYIGAPYNNYIDMGVRLLFLIKGWNISGALFNGGLSLRSKSKALEVLEKYPWDEKTPEDVWFCAFLPKIHAYLPTSGVAQQFAYESLSNFNHIPFGLHKPRKNKDLLEEYCPEYQSIPFLPAYTDYKTLYLV